MSCVLDDIKVFDCTILTGNVVQSAVKNLWSVSHIALIYLKHVKQQD